MPVSDCLQSANIAWRFAQTVTDDVLVTTVVLLIAGVTGLLPDASALPTLSDVQGAPIDSARRLTGLAPAAGMIFALYWCLKLPYQVFFLTRCDGQTPGCRLFGLRIVLMNGKPVNWRAAAGRTIAGGVLANAPVIGQILRFLDYVYTLFNQKRQAIRDVAAGTVLIHSRRLSRESRTTGVPWMTL